MIKNEGEVYKFSKLKKIYPKIQLLIHGCAEAHAQIHFLQIDKILDRKKLNILFLDLLPFYYNPSFPWCICS